MRLYSANLLPNYMLREEDLVSELSELSRCGGPFLYLQSERVCPNDPRIPHVRGELYGGGSRPRCRAPSSGNKPVFPPRGLLPPPLLLQRQPLEPSPHVRGLQVFLLPACVPVSVCVCESLQGSAGSVRALWDSSWRGGKLAIFLVTLTMQTQ